jgi:hypothetical protein
MSIAITVQQKENKATFAVAESTLACELLRTVRALELFQTAGFKLTEEQIGEVHCEVPGGLGRMPLRMLEDDKETTLQMLECQAMDIFLPEPLDIPNITLRVFASDDAVLPSVEVRPDSTSADVCAALARSFGELATGHIVVLVPARGSTGWCFLPPFSDSMWVGGLLAAINGRIAATFALMRPPAVKELAAIAIKLTDTDIRAPVAVAAQPAAEEEQEDTTDRADDEATAAAEESASRREFQTKMEERFESQTAKAGKKDDSPTDFLMVCAPCPAPTPSHHPSACVYACVHVCMCACVHG